MQRVAFLVLLFSATLGTGCSERSTPRVLLLLTSDTLRADRLSAYGSELALTPHLDGLLSESEVFRFAYAPSSYTLPSLAALLTGRQPEELGLLANVSRMGEDFATLASVLQLHGWATGAVVSNYVVREGTGVERGFEFYDATFPGRELNRDMPERIAPDTTHAALALLDRLLAEDRPVFLWVHYQDPHGPYLPPPGHRERYLETERSAPDGRRQLEAGRGSAPDVPVAEHRGLGAIPLYQVVDDQQEVAFYRAGYDGEVAYLDEEIGRLLAGMDERDALEMATVVFSADHGEGLGERDYWFAHGEYLNDPLVRVPLAIRVPGREPRERSDPAALVDLFPTLLALAGVEPPPSYPGRDLLAADAEETEPEIYLASLRGATVPRFGLVADGYKYVASQTEDGIVEELYALGDESRDLSAREVERVARMRERLLELRRGLRRPTRERHQELTAADREKLRRLGYLVE